MAQTLDTVLLEAATKALAAAPKTTCLPKEAWFCLTSAEWASWMQAFGSVLAIVGSLWVARHQAAKQHNYSLRQIRAQHDLEKSSAAAALELIAGGVAASVIQVADIIDSKHPPELETRLVDNRIGEIEAHLDANTSISVADFPADSVAHHLSLSLLVRATLHGAKLFKEADAEKREHLRPATSDWLRRQANHLVVLAENIRDGTFKLPDVMANSAAPEADRKNTEQGGSSHKG
jgi:hypothetical protein